MYIKLPDNFSYIVKGRRYAVVENDTLYIFAIGNISWEKMVYEMSYEIHGSNTCKYCGRKNCKDMTLDHKFAISQGGVSIPDNLVPVCQKCNIRKSYMNYEQYKKYLSKSQNQREVYKEGIDKETVKHLTLESECFFRKKKYILAEMQFSWPSRDSISFL